MSPEETVRARRASALGGRQAAATLSLLAAITACASAQEMMGSLPRAVKAYNELVRWGKYESAGAFRTAEDRLPFLERYLAAEDDLHVDSMEIRSVVWPAVEPEEPLAAEVVIVAHAYLLPSTVVEKVIIGQRWEYRDGRWVLVTSDRELAPPLDDVADESPPPGEQIIDAPAAGQSEEPPTTAVPAEIER